MSSYEDLLIRKASFYLVERELKKYALAITRPDSVASGEGGLVWDQFCAESLMKAIDALRGSER